MPDKIRITQSICISKNYKMHSTSNIFSNRGKTFVSILSNAYKYTPHDHSHRSIYIRKSTCF